MSESAPRLEVMKQIIALAHFVVLCSLAIAGVLLLADLFGRGWSSMELRFLTEKLLITLVYGIAAEVVAAIAAATCLALWK
jgi:hypothetical protein